jgi:phospholipid transport system substrate-binding protein
MRRLLVAALALAISSSSAYALDTKAASTFVDKVAGDALAIVKSSDAQPAKQAKLETLFKANANIPFVAQFVLGRHWAAATPAQKKAYLAAYEPFLMKHYIGRIVKYSGQSYKITRARRMSGDAAVVTMEIADAGKPSVFVDYRVRQEGKNFKVTDIIVEGVSLLGTQRYGVQCGRTE